VPLLCKNCGTALQGADEAAIFLCPLCGVAYEPVEGELAGFRPLTASATTELAVGGKVQYLAFWRLVVALSRGVEGAWTRLCRAQAPDPAYLYMPAFTLAKAVMQRLGVSLTQFQPRLELTSGLATDRLRRPALAEVGRVALPGSAGVAPTGSDFGTLSPVVVGRSDCQVLAHFIFLAVESHEAPTLSSVDYELETKSEELVFVPAVWDLRYAHDANWRFLLREYDGQVA
jgi:hypothetical protein